ncbi:Bifunctional solanapyrone synthase [Lachnellula arida]|uniref:Bifunctional solanapyrone synthase n=1 Tax=Lachnellula arida TaxID=1316785 RepID=A0A8T9B3P5_9HELO|nr:Bifunctional solanapyrone synthase [Lachnellula arida]
MDKNSYSIFSRFIMVSIGLLAVALPFLYRLTIGYSGNGTSASASANATCEQLSSLLGAVIILPSDAQQYTTLSDENWSQTAWKQPSCIALPACTSDLQQLIKTLVAQNVPFAIRSGGHSPNPFDANIDTGVLIAMDNFNTVTYNTAQRLASFAPGARWNTVYTALDPYNVTLVGGRVMDVGVGGLTLGSGLSYLSDLYGLVCDNVVNYEVVLADGSVVDANSRNNADLFWALKGGSNNFGILTKITTPTYPISQVWGSVRIFTADQMPKVVQALYEYQTTPEKDLYANMVLNLAASNSSVILTLVYLKPVDSPEAFAPFYGLTPVQQQTGLMTLHQLMALFPLPALPRWTWYTNTFEPNSDLYAQISSLLTATTPEVATISALQGGTLVGTAQPINANVALAGEAGGGNTLNLQPINQTWFSLNAAWWNADDDIIAYAAIKSLHAKIEALAEHAAANLQYIFMNDANINQSVISSYGDENVQRLHAIQKVYDPQLVFQKLVTGGQKIPA